MVDHGTLTCISRNAGEITGTSYFSEDAGSGEQNITNDGTIKGETACGAIPAANIFFDRHSGADTIVEFDEANDLLRIAGQAGGF